MTRGGWTIAFFLTIASSLCVAQSDALSVADVAKKLRLEKKVSVTLSDDNFVRRTPVESKTSASLSDTAASAAASPNAAKGEATTGKAAEALKKDDLKKEDLKRAEELKKKLDSFKADREAWNLSAKRYEDLLANEPDQFRRQMYQDALDNDRGNVSFYQKKIDETAANTAVDSGADAAKTDQATSGGSRP